MGKHNQGRRVDRSRGEAFDQRQKRGGEEPCLGKRGGAIRLASTLAPRTVVDISAVDIKGQRARPGELNWCHVLAGSPVLVVSSAIDASVGHEPPDFIVTAVADSCRNGQPGGSGRGRAASRFGEGGPDGQPEASYSETADSQHESVVVLRSAGGVEAADAVAHGSGFVAALGSTCRTWAGGLH